MSDVCLICGSSLRYLDSAEEMTCAVCGKTCSGNACCTEGHYICDACHASPAEAAVRAVARETKSTNPIEIAQQMMRSPAVHMHGPEHHFLVGAALLAAYRNCGADVDFDTALSAIVSRGKLVPGGFCGLAGNCGAAVSAGIFASVIQKATPLSDTAWAQSLRMTAFCLNAVAEHGGPRCCKRDSFASITAAAEFFRQEFSFIFPLSDNIICEFSKNNRECLKEVCPYYTL